jgi:hypothetical protein
MILAYLKQMVVEVSVFIIWKYINPWMLNPAYALPWLRRGKQVQHDKVRSNVVE